MRMIGFALLCVGLVAMGMYGLNQHIEYSGWVLATGLLVAASRA